NRTKTSFKILLLVESHHNCCQSQRIGRRSVGHQIGRSLPAWKAIPPSVSCKTSQSRISDMLKTLVGRTRSRQSRRVDAPDFPSKTSGPRISIVTVSYNSAATLAKTIESVANQNYLNLEHVVVDGKSTDGSLDIIRANADKISKWISEDDRGIYHAMNKGWSLSTGDYVGFLN